jgi:streptogramin lyase
MNIRRRTPRTHLGRLLASVAEQEIREDYDPWPLVAGRLRRHEVEKIEHRRRWWIEGLKLAAAGLVVGLIGIMLVLTFRLTADDQVAVPNRTPVVTPQSTPPAVMPPPASDLPSAGQVTTTIPLPVEGRPAIYQAPTHWSIWAPQASTGSVTRIAPGQLASSTISFAEGGVGDPIAVASSDDWVWIATDRAIVQIDPMTNAIVATVEVSGTPLAIATGFDSVWITTSEPDTLVRINIATRTIVATVPDVVAGTSLVASDDAVWILGQANNGTLLTRVDPAADQVSARISLDLPNVPSTGAGCQTCAGEVTTAAGDIWVALSGLNALARVDAATNLVTVVIPVGESPVSVVADDRGIWVGHGSGDGLFLIDPETNSVVAATRLTTPQQLSALVAHDGAIWAASDIFDVIVRVEPAS